MSMTDDAMTDDAMTLSKEKTLSSSVCLFVWV